jgi:hypothetical protein
MNYRYKDATGGWKKCRATRAQMREKMMKSLRQQLAEGRTLAQTRFVYSPI